MHFLVKTYKETNISQSCTISCSNLQVTGKTCDEVPVLSPEVQYYSSFTYCVLRVSEKEKNKPSTTETVSMTTSGNTNHGVTTSENTGVKSIPYPFLNVLLSVILISLLFAEYTYTNQI